MIKQTIFIEKREEFFRLLSDSTIDVDDAFLVSEDFIQVQYSKKNYFKEETRHSNVIIAAYVTAHARIELYNLLDRLGKRCLYFDTDSVIFTHDTNEWKPETGYYLGQLTDEVITPKEPNNYISKFISCGSKNYAYVKHNPNTSKNEYICKVKGLSLNFETSSYVNFDSMKKLMEEFVETENRSIIDVPQFNIRTNNFYEVFSECATKKYRINYDRRIIKSDLTTRPFGFVEKV